MEREQESRKPEEVKREILDRLSSEEHTERREGRFVEVQCWSTRPDDPPPADVTPTIQCWATGNVPTPHPPKDSDPPQKPNTGEA